MNKELFSEFDSFALKGFEQLYPALAELIPMKPSQKKELPHVCRELSEYLTTDREFLSRPYWSTPKLLSAYFHYFMVWNLVRLCRLFPNLNLGSVPDRTTFMDLGSGPLTIPLALWLSRKDLRAKEITFICADLAPQPLQLGKKLFEKLRSSLDPGCPWKIQTLRTPNHKAFRQIHEPIYLLTMGNVLNEGDEKKNITAFEQIRQLYENACQVLADDGKIFAVEPGTRQGARMIQILRKLAVSELQDFDEDYDEEYAKDTAFTHSPDKQTDFVDSCDFEEHEAPFSVISPCPQGIRCPLVQTGHKQNAWCHFNSKTEFIPKELKELSQKAGLDKDSVSLSYLYLAPKKEAEKLLQTDRSADKARIISDAFTVPRFKGRARYACHKKGLLLILDCACVPTGTLCEVRFPAKAEKDFKSKALLCTLKNKNYNSLKEAEISDKNTPADQTRQHGSKAKEAASKRQSPQKKLPQNNLTKKKRH